ncbi:MAG: glycosyl hydrolase [Pseudomonadota bacterium]
MPTRWLLAVALLTFVLPIGAPLATAQDDAESEPGFNEATFQGMEWRSVGPALMAGRIADIAIDPNDQSTWYVGVGSGGIWKTDNAGTTWTTIFDNEDAYSIGCITVDPNDSSTLWVGTGENVSGRHVGYGAGVYRSRDGGTSWENLGLEDSEHIGMIRVDPRDSNVVYVAAQGPLWSGGGERGLYKTTDGGETWDKILGDGLGNDESDDAYTGVSEVHFDPRDPDVLYAVSWQRFRNVAVLMDGGPGTGIHKSTDGGATWRRLASGLPSENLGKTGIAISPQNPDVLYATIELANRTGGFFRSSDGGDTWEKRNEYISGGTGPHYYNEIFASPHQFDRVYQMDVQMHVTNDGGENFENLSHESKHSDHHAMAFDPEDPDYLLVGTDGGLYESFDLGETWRFAANMPITQYYKVSVDYAEPFYNIYGGTQDNNSHGGPSRTMDAHGIENSDWFITLFGDGHQSAADPDNPNIIYAEWQQGNLVRYDKATGEQVYIRPQAAEGEPSERFNWDAPILISPHDSQTLYFASQRIWRSDDRGDSWRAISGDLTRNENRVRQPLMGRTWGYESSWDLYAMSRFNTIVNISESPLVQGLIYAGTDDGLIQVTEDGGETWRRIDRLPGVPSRFFVNDIKADLHDPDTVYVVVDDHKGGDFSPYILKSENRGRSWRSISNNLPERHILWRVVQDHVKPELLFVGSEFGVFFTVDGGRNWTKLSGGAPNIPFRDLAIQKRENDLVGATFGRSFYVLDDYSALRNVTAEQLAGETTLFPVRKTPWYVPRRSLGCSSNGCTSSQGDAYYVAENPPFGAVMTYYLPEGISSTREARQERDKELADENDNVVFPDWDALRAEDLEDAPSMVITISDSSGNVIRNIDAPASGGFNRVAWDLRYPAIDAWQAGQEREPGDVLGVLVSPGRYSAQLKRRVIGVAEAVGAAQSFDVVSIREPTLPGSSQEARVQFEQQASELSRAADGTYSAVAGVMAELELVKQALANANTADSLYSEALRIHRELALVNDQLGGEERRSIFNESAPMSVADRLWHATFAPNSNAYGPTPAQRESLRIATSQYQGLLGQLRELIDRDYAALKTAMDSAGVAWTPGRGLLAPNP